MANIDVKLKLKDFRLKRENETSADEPYLWVFYLKLDGNTVDLFTPENSHVELHAPAGSHGDLGAGAVDGLEVHSGAIAIPSAIGEFTTTLSSDNIAFAPPLEPYCYVAALIVALEADASLSGDMELARQKFRDELQKQLNTALRSVVSEVKDAIMVGGALPSPQEVQDRLQNVDIAKLKKVVTDSVAGSATDDVVGGVIGLLTGLFPFFGLAQAVDPDDFVGYAIVGPFLMSDLISHADIGQNFTADLGSMSSTDGMYRITGHVQRTDSTEVTSLAVNYAPLPRTRASNCLDIYVRDSFRKFSRSRGAPATINEWTALWNRLPDGTFLSAPAVASSNDGQLLHVFGLGLDSQIWHGRSQDGGAHWVMAWAPIGEGVFASGPAAAVSADGKKLHVFGRGLDNKIWRAYSPDAGVNWALAWAPIGEGVFNSAPAAALSNDGSLLHVFGRGLDNKIWRAFSPNGGDSWDLAWEPIGEGVFTSGPAAVLSGDGQKLHVFGRGNDNRIWRAFTPNGGGSWAVAWSPIGDGVFTSGPAATMSSDGTQLHVVGLGNDLQPWRAFSTNGGSDWQYAWGQVPGTIGF